MTQFVLEVAAGQSRSGKSWETNRRTKLEPRLLAWDAMGEWSDKFRCQRITTAAELRAIAAAGKGGRFAFCVPVTRENFELFCRCAWLWIRLLAHRGESVTVVVEELADVTPPGKAPPAWGEIIRKSLRFGTRIYALTQAPAESDKTVLRNATVLRCHAMGREPDRRAMAREMDVPQAQLDALDLARFEYLERDAVTRELHTAGKGKRRRTA